MENLLKILIIEDDLNFLSILRQAFEENNFKVAFARDGVEGLSLVQQENPDLILLDILMPKMNGIETAKKIKELNIKTPIIFLTNLGDISSINKAMDSVNFDLDYMIKTDVHIDQIIARVREKLVIK